MISLSPKRYNGAEYDNFERAWFSQPSTARMTENGDRLDCSDTVDATNHYIWRQDGKVNGACCGIDFQQAAEKRRKGTCVDNRNNSTCASALAGLYTTFAYDAAMVMAHGLDRLVQRGVDPYSASANELAMAMRQSTLSGASGSVSFDDNGDRSVKQLEHIVYNYDASGGVFRVAGSMSGNGSFTRCSGCSPIIFSSGSDHVPNVQRGVRDTLSRACFLNPTSSMCGYLPSSDEHCNDLGDSLCVTDTQDWSPTGPF